VLIWLSLGKFSACDESISDGLLWVDWVKDRILLSSGLDGIVLALFGAPMGLPGVFSFLFLSIIVHSPSGVALAPRMLIAGVVSVSRLNVKAIGAGTGNNLGLNLSACFTLASSLCFAGHAWDHDV
jgi:hypothetical protein